MAYRLHPAGIPTQQSEHFVNYHVVPKRVTPSSPNCSQTIQCCLRQRLVCLRRSSNDSACACHGSKYVCCEPCPPVRYDCGFKSTIPKCSLPKCNCCCCCCKTEKGTQSRICMCCNSTKNKENAREIIIKLPKCEGSDQDHKMRKKLHKLKKNLDNFDQALACMGSNNGSCVSESLNISYKCNKPESCKKQKGKNTKKCKVCCVPMVCQETVTSEPCCEKICCPRDCVGC